MVQHKTILKVVDNSGAKSAQCIRVLGGYQKRFGIIGDFILVSIKSLRTKISKLKVQRKCVFKAIIIQTKSLNRKNTGFNIKFKDNAIILIDKQNNPLATRIKCFVLEKLKIRFYKLISISLNYIN